MRRPHYCCCAMMHYCCTLFALYCAAPFLPTARTAKCVALRHMHCSVRCAPYCAHALCPPPCAIAKQVSVYI